MENVKILLDKLTETWKQRAIAEHLGVSEQRLSQWKTGKVPMPEHQFAKLAELAEGKRKAQVLLWEFVKLKASTKEKISAGFKLLLSLGKPLGDSFYAV